MINFLILASVAALKKLYGFQVLKRRIFYEKKGWYLFSFKYFFMYHRVICIPVSRVMEI